MSGGLLESDGGSEGADRRLQVAVLGSGKGSNFGALLEARGKGELGVDFCVVVSDHEDAGILGLAREAGVPTLTVREPRYRTRLSEEVERWLAQELVQRGTELVVLAGWMRVVKAPLLEAFRGRMINIHPSLLPEFPGLRAWEQALAAGVAKTGCTVHWVDEGVDTGPVIARAEVPVLPGDTAESLHARIQEAEHRLLPAVVGWLAANRQAMPWRGGSCEGTGWFLREVLPWGC